MNGKYRSLPALSMSNNCTNLPLLKKKLCCVFYQRKCCINNRNSFEISLSNADAEDQKFDVIMTSLSLTLK